MAYVDSRNSRERTASAIASAALVGAIGYALATGLAIRVTHRALPDLILRAWPAPPPPPPPPEIAPAPRAASHPAAAAPASPRPLVPLPPIERPFVDVPPATPPVIVPSLVPPATGDTAAVAPSLARGASAFGDRSRWLSTDDYPAAALRAGAEGRTGVTLGITIDGRATSCTVTASSGSAELDRATCQLLQRRGRFRAARDDAGHPVAATIVDSVVWRLPRD